MVVFSCNACGESLKKKDVQKHRYSHCRGSNVLSCLDCNKEFWGNEYEQHIKCISEEEKYSGKNFVPRPNANKNEIKQELWFHQVQQAIEKAKTNPQLRDVLLRVKECPNVPRKEKKFINFLSSSLNCRNQHLCSQAWKVLLECVEKPAQNGNEPGKEGAKANGVKCNNTDGTSAPDQNGGTSNEVKNDEASKVLNKRDKKEERRKKHHKTEKKDKQTISDTQDNVATETTRKKKKRKHDETEDASNDISVLAADETPPVDSDDQAPQPATKKFKTKFNWSEVIIEVLKSKGPEMKSKKLKRKVLAEYLSQGCVEHSEEKLWAKFDKRVKKIPGVKLLGDKVKLVNQKT